jgi:hypothetical protein
VALVDNGMAGPEGRHRRLSLTARIEKDKVENRPQVNRHEGCTLDFPGITDRPLEVMTFRHSGNARAWPGVKMPMTDDIVIDHENKIIQRNVSGELHTNRSLNLVHELSLSMLRYRGYHILMDLRGTFTRPEMLDLMAIASECAKLRADFSRRIAFLIPDTEERQRFAQLFKACMDTQGFAFKQFTDPGAARAWLLEAP